MPEREREGGRMSASRLPPDALMIMTITIIITTLPQYNNEELDKFDGENDNAWKGGRDINETGGNWRGRQHKPTILMKVAPTRHH